MGLALSRWPWMTMNPRDRGAVELKRVGRSVPWQRLVPRLLVMQHLGGIAHVHHLATGRAGIEVLSGVVKSGG
jgi:hypothetical protein